MGDSWKIIPVLVGVLILGTIGLSQNVFADQNARISILSDTFGVGPTDIIARVGENIEWTTSALVGMENFKVEIIFGLNPPFGAPYNSGKINVFTNIVSPPIDVSATRSDNNIFAYTINIYDGDGNLFKTTNNVRVRVLAEVIQGDANGHHTPEIQHNPEGDRWTNSIRFSTPLQIGPGASAAELATLRADFPGWTFRNSFPLGGSLTVLDYDAFMITPERPIDGTNHNCNLGVVGGTKDCTGFSYTQQSNIVNLNNFRWLQMICTNSPANLGKICLPPGSLNSYVDPFPNDDTLPFYYTEAEHARFTGAGGKPFTFYDQPSRTFPVNDATLEWRANLYLVKWDGNIPGVIAIKEGISYGFTLGCVLIKQPPGKWNSGGLDKDKPTTEIIGPDPSGGSPFDPPGAPPFECLIENSYTFDPPVSILELGGKEISLIIKNEEPDIIVEGESTGIASFSTVVSIPDANVAKITGISSTAPCGSFVAVLLDGGSSATIEGLNCDIPNSPNSIELAKISLEPLEEGQTPLLINDVLIEGTPPMHEPEVSAPQFPLEFDTFPGIVVVNPDSKLKIIKQTLGGEGTFVFNSPQLGEFEIAIVGNEGSINFSELPSGPYPIMEVVPEGWVQNSATCDNGQNPNNLILNFGDDVTCTFVNEKIDNCPNNPDTDGDGTGDACDPNTEITSDTIATDTTFGGDLTVDGASFTIPSGVTVDFDFVNHKIVIKSPSGKILVQLGGKIT